MATDVRIRLPHRARSTRPLLSIAGRFGFALLLVVINWLIVVVERGSYNDSHDGDVSVIDALYYTTVTLSTTGYGDITPITDQARLINALLVTPMRVLFVIVLVGTTISALTERSREQFRLDRWRSRVNNHVVVLGFGTKGRNAVRALQLKGHPLSSMVVIDTDAEAIANAASAGLVAVNGSAISQTSLHDALIHRARAVVVALSRDDTSVLATLAVRRLAPTVTIVATAREAENAVLLKQSGATSVIISDETSGRLLGLATDSPETVAVVEDLLSFGEGLDLHERPVTEEESGCRPRDLDVPVIAVIRGDRTLRYSDPALGILQRGDRIVYAAS